MSAIAVQTQNLHKSYLLGATAVGALRGVDLTVERGEFVALMGPSGCGKTTLLNLIGAIDTPSRGGLSVDGVALENLSEDQLADLRRERIGVVFQFYNLLPTLSARENIELPMQFKGLGRRERRERALWLLERVGLKDRADHKPAELSGGEQQRVSIARALANEPALVLLDEPTGDLDSATGKEIMALLQDLNQREKVTLIIATHDPLIAQASSRISGLRAGRVESDSQAGASQSGAPASAGRRDGRVESDSHAGA
jgi:putative ABC transport system ATP-binding protein